MIQTDICIIGAGSGGLSVAAGAAQMGARVVLIEGAAMGGDCLNHGCVPSKALLAMAARGADYRTAMDHVAATIAAIAPMDSQARFEGFGVTVLRGWARFTGPRQVAVADQTVSARRFVIATGSRPVIPPVPGLAGLPYLTNESLFDLRERPDHLIILGAGPIGLEMAQAHVRLGARVTVVDAGPAMGREDPDAAAVVLTALRAEGVLIRDNTAVTAASGQAGAITLDTAAGSVTGTHLLVATGRRAALSDLGLDAAGVGFTPQGVTVDAHLRSRSNRRVFAVGDAAGQGQFTHLAGYHAGVVVRQAVLGLRATTRADHIPRATYTSPELAHVGLLESDARAAHGGALTVLTLPMTSSDRAEAEGNTTGFVKVMVARGRPVGATIVGPQAGDQIQFWALALAARLKMSALAGVVLPYPTRAEVNKRAVSAYFAPRLFDSPMVKRVVRAVQRWMP